MKNDNEKKAVANLKDNIGGTTVPKVVEYEVDGQQIRLTMGTIRKFIAKGNDEITDEEIGMFMSLCKYQKLNPFLGDSFLVKYDSSKPAQNVVSKEAFMKRAYKQPNFDGFRAGVIVETKEGVIEELQGSFMPKGYTLLGGWAEVHVKDRKIPYVVKVDLNEYHKKQSTWNAMPKTMIRKVAVVQALREAFPVELGGMYITEEPFFNNENVIDQTVEEVEKETANKEIPVVEKTGEVEEVVVDNIEEEPDWA